MVEMEKCTHLGTTVLPHHPIPFAFPGVLVAAAAWGSVPSATWRTMPRGEQARRGGTCRACGEQDELMPALPSVAAGSHCRF